MSLIATSEAKLSKWIESQNFRGWDPYDALNSPLLSQLTFGQRRIGQVWVQLLKRSPLNLRPLLGIPKVYNAKGMGLFLSSYWRKYQTSGDSAHLTKVNYFANWLVTHTSPGYRGACWGYPFPWPNRGFFAPAGLPTIVNTAFVGLAFLRLAEEAPAIAPELAQQARTIGESACEFISHSLNQHTVNNNELCFSYTPTDKRYVHNANMMGAWLLAGVGALTDNDSYKALAQKAARYTLRHQKADGAWLYGEGSSDHWIDNFHTGFVLTALKAYGRYLHIDEAEAATRLGYTYWKSHFFLEDGTPRYYHNHLYPIDVHCIAQAILTFIAFADEDSEAMALAQRTAVWGITHFQAPAGYYHFQHTRYWQNRIPYMRWSQAWMQAALVELIHAEKMSPFNRSL